MPNIIITEEEFKKLTDGTKKEIWELLKESFSTTTVSDDLSDKNLGNLIKNSIKENSLNFDTLSIETAIAVLIGLSDESRKVVEALCRSQQSRESLTEILGSEKKINGTIGSINRRLAKRLDEKIYGKRRDRLKLIQYDEYYRLSCDNRALEIALFVLHKGYKIGQGDILLKYKSIFDENKEHKAEVLIKEEDIIQSDSGGASIHLAMWDYQTGHINNSFSVNVMYSSPTDKVVVSTDYGEEWEANSFTGNLAPDGQPNEIVIGGKKR